MRRSEEKNGKEIQKNHAPAMRDMNFKVAKDIHDWIKGEAAARGLSMKEFVIECFKAYLNAHGSMLRSDRERFP